MDSMFNELPSGVPIPPIAAQAPTVTVRALARPDWPLIPPFASTIAKPIPMKIAAAAKSEMNIERMPVVIPKATISFVVLFPAKLSAAFATHIGMGVDMTAPETAKTNRQ